MISVEVEGVGHVKTNLSNFGVALFQATTSAARQTAMEAQGVMWRMIANGEFRVRPPRQTTLARRTSGFTVPLYDEGGYADSWRGYVTLANTVGGASDVMMATIARVEIGPTGYTRTGLDRRVLAQILDKGTSRTVARPHIRRFADVMQRRLLQLVRERVAQAKAR